MKSFTNLEKVMLVNQYEILKRVDPENCEHYDELVEIIRSGYSVFYSMIDDWFGTDMPSEEGEFVLDILDFYTGVELYKKKNPNDQEVISHPNSQFRGFDGNHESKYLGFVRFLLEKQHKFSEISALRNIHDNYNSHRPFVQTYKSIIAAWKTNGGNFPQTQDEILIPLNAATR